MIFEGTATALVTPFTTDDKVDARALERLIDFQLQEGVDALCVLGTTSESATLSEKEKQQIIELAVSRVKGKIPVIVGAGSSCTAHAIGSCKTAQRLGADALLIVTPYYNKCTQDGLVKHYGAIADATSLPIIAYNVPSRTGVNLLPSTLAELARNANIAGIKEASGNMTQILECIRLVGDKIGVYSGDDALAAAVLAMGGSGVISVASNVYPRLVADMCRQALSGNIRKASRKQLELLPLISALFCEVNPIPIKKALELKGLCSGELRLPLTKMSKQNAERLRIAMSALA